MQPLWVNKMLWYLGNQTIDFRDATISLKESCNVVTLDGP